MVAEFDCAECGSHIVDIVADKVRYPALCAICMHLPGWFTDPVLLKTFDPERAREQAQKALAASMFQLRPVTWLDRAFCRLFRWVFPAPAKSRDPQP